MRPGDHPEFFRSPPPPGRSRESTIRLAASGYFFHEGERVEHPGLAAAMHTWIARHPDDGRYVLTNGYDWTYFTVEDTPFFVRAVRVEPDRVVLRLSDGSEEPWDPQRTKFEGERVVTTVKRDAPGGPFQARFDRHALIVLGEVLSEEDGRMFANVGQGRVAIGA